MGIENDTHHKGGLLHPLRRITILMGIENDTHEREFREFMEFNKFITIRLHYNIIIAQTTLPYRHRLTEFYSG